MLDLVHSLSRADGSRCQISGVSGNKHLPVLSHHHLDSTVGVNPFLYLLKQSVTDNFVRVCYLVVRYTTFLYMWDDQLMFSIHHIGKGTVVLHAVETFQRFISTVEVDILTH